MKKTIVLGLLLAGLGVSSAHGITLTWTWNGGGADNNWTTTNNWTATIPGTAPANGGFEDFGGSTRLTPYNNEINLQSNGIMFEGGAGAFTLTGNGISMQGAVGIANDSSSLQTIDLDITLTAAQTFSASSGPLTISGTIDGAFPLTLSGPYPITLRGAVGSGTPLSSVTENGAVPVTMVSITASGNVDFSHGGGVQLAGNAIMQSSAGNVNLGTGTVKGNGYSLLVAAPGTTTLKGGATGFSTLSIGGGGVLVSGGTVQALGNVDFTGASTVSLDGGTWVTSGTASANFGTAAVQGNGYSLLVAAPGTTTLKGGATGFSNFAVAGGGVFAASGTMMGSGNIDLSGATSVDLGGDYFLNFPVISSAPVKGNGHSLMLTAANTIILNGASGLANLTVAGGLVALTGTASASGNLDYSPSGAVSLNGNAWVSSTGGGNVSLPAVQGNLHMLMIDTSGLVTFDGELNGVTMLDVMGNVVNNSTLQAPSGTSLIFHGPVANYGVINALYGNVTFYSSVMNYGTIITSNCPPIITSIQVAGLNVEITFTTCSNVPYEVDYDTDPVSGTWTPLTNLTAAGSITSVSDPGAAVLPQRFYRAGLVDSYE